MKNMMSACLFMVFLGSAAMLAAQQPTSSEIGGTSPDLAPLFQLGSSLLSASRLVPAPDSAELILDRAYLPHTVMKEEQVRPWKRYAVIGGAITATYFHFEIAPTYENEFNRGYGPSTGWGYVIYAVPGALLGAFAGVAIAYGGSN